MAATSKQAIAKAQGGKRRYHEVAEDEAPKPAPKFSKKAATKSAGDKPSKKVTIDAPSNSDDSDDDDSDDEAAAQASSSVRNKLAKKGVELEKSDSEDDSAEEEAEDNEAANRNAPIVDIVRLPSSKDDAAVKARLDAVSKRRAQEKQKATNVGVIYVGRVPKGFYEPQMKAYFGQFGKVNRLRLSRNPKTGAPRHYGFVEFDDIEVAKIVAETMDNYLIMGHLLQVKVVPQDEVHPNLFKGAGRWYSFAGKNSRDVEDERIQREHERHDRPRSTEEQKKTDEALLKRQEQRRQTLNKKGIDYDFPGYQVA